MSETKITEVNFFLEGKVVESHELDFIPREGEHVFIQNLDHEGIDVGFSDSEVFEVSKVWWQVHSHSVIAEVYLKKCRRSSRYNPSLPYEDGRMHQLLEEFVEVYPAWLSISDLVRRMDGPFSVDTSQSHIENLEERGFLVSRGAESITLYRATSTAIDKLEDEDE